MRHGYFLALFAPQNPGPRLYHHIPGLLLPLTWPHPSQAGLAGTVSEGTQECGEAVGGGLAVS